MLEIHTVGLYYQKNQSNICGILPCVGSMSYLYQIIKVSLKVSQALWQSYTNVILENLQTEESILHYLIILLNQRTEKGDGHKLK